MLVVGEDGKRLSGGLRDEESVEGVAVVGWQGLECEDVLLPDGEQLHAVLRQLVV